MSRLRQAKYDAKKTFETYKSRLPEVPRIPLVEATAVPAKSLFAPSTIEAGRPDLITSEPIFLQTGTDEVRSFAVDLSRLHAGIVFSVILSSSPTDILGRELATILVRNGVTATAARKVKGKPMAWFYHGKPMNDGDMRLHVTIGRDQMTFAYYEDGRLYVHGDCPLSRLSKEHIGDVKGIPFYVHIYTKDKQAGKEPSSTIDLLDINGKGYIHESVGQDERNDFGFELIKAEEGIASPEQDAELAAQDDWNDDLLKDFAGVTFD